MATETNITKGIMKYLKSLPNSKWLKVHGSAFQDSGTADILGCWQGHKIAFEVKQWTNKESDIQIHVRGEYTKAGAMCFVVHSTPEARMCMESIMDHLSKYTDALAKSRGFAMEQAGKLLQESGPPAKKKTPKGDGDTPFG